MLTVSLLATFPESHKSPLSSASFSACGGDEDLIGRLASAPLGGGDDPTQPGCCLIDALGILTIFAAQAFDGEWFGIFGRLRKTDEKC
jgi:hypothetical protein